MNNYISGMNDASPLHLLERSPAQQALRARYAACRDEAGTPGRPPGSDPALAVVMVRGLFGAWIPGHFRAPLRWLRQVGWPAHIARTDPTGTIEANARALGAQIDTLIATGQRPVFLAHSKGGLEVLLALAERPELATATAGFIGVQVPRAGAPYLESLFSPAHLATRQGADRWREPVEAALLMLLGARAACAEIDTARVHDITARLDRTHWPFPRLMVATHTTRATRSLEMRHARLAQIFPGALHDGVFRTVDQLWPGARNLWLPDIDHAQPSVGGLGFGHDRFWAALLALLFTDDC